MRIHTWPDVALDRQAFQRHVWFAARDLLGDVGSAELDLSVVQFSFESGAGEAIVRTHRGAVGAARAALACVGDIDDHPVGVRVSGVSGTVRGCEEAYLASDPKVNRESTVAFEGTDRPAHCRDGRVDVEVDDGFVGATRLDLS